MILRWTDPMTRAQFTDAYHVLGRWSSGKVVERFCDGCFAALLGRMTLPW